jgi:Na+:H+ antiporter, NhaA family
MPPATLTPPVDPVRDHVRGPEVARVLLVEYGDFQCPSCREAYPVVHRLLDEFHGQIRFVFRHMPLTDLHPAAQGAAEAAEAAGAQGRFWEMHDRLFEHQGALGEEELSRHAEALGLDLDAFRRDLAEGAHRARVAEDYESGIRSGVPSTPCFFVDGVIHLGTASAAELELAIGAAPLDAG